MLFALTSGTAHAQFYVRSPEVKKGEIELEEHGALYFGPGEDERRRQGHELGLNYGLTDRVKVIAEALSFPKIPSGLDSHRKAESSHD